jgi:transcriptional regulator with PAS, ATPase and Fis domain
MQTLYNSKFPILIQGETGTGKSSFAKKIHRNSNYKNREFIKCNVAGLTENLFESELFGHVKGSFTGAISDKIGFFDLVGEGTLFLDEIGELSLSQQKKLLNILDEKKYLRVGGIKYKTFNGRFIFATHRDLEQMVRSGQFREDLFYRLGGQSIKLRPFWRKTDQEKMSFFKKEFYEVCRKYDLPKVSISNKCLEIFTTYSWPGNFREIKNTIELLLLKNETGHICTKDLPMRFVDSGGDIGSFNKQISILEKKLIENEVVNKGIGINKASKSLGISKTTLIAKIRKYGITVHQVKDEIQYAA